MGLVAPLPAAAQAPRDALLLTPARLAERMADPDLVLWHVGDKADYDARHLAGARFVTLADLSVGSRETGGLTLELPPPAILRERLAALGVSDRSHVVVYYATNQITASTRIMLTLDHAGLGARSSLLDGGMGAWIRDGRALTSAVPAARTGVLAPLATRPVTVDAATVKAGLTRPQTVVVDARLTPFYDGAQVGGSRESPHKTGHIAGAKSVPWSDLTTAQQAFRPAEELRARFEKAGVAPGDTVIAYCHIGQQATAVVFAARTLGLKVLLYDGSFEDWSRQPDYPVASTVKKDH
jgi:thiosulfate/3-mercaptopyruvate sulfurtransferase